MNELKEIYESEILLTESKNPYIIGHLTCDAAEGEIATKNNNTYSTALLKRESGALNKRIEKSGVLGCLEHPPTFNSPLNKASHIITKSRMKGNRMEIESAVLNTPSGKAFWTILNSGIKSIGASIRGAGTRGYNGKIQDDYRLSSIDFVSAPAAECATIDKSNIIESYVPTQLDETFFSLRDNLSTAIKKEFGKEYWLVDFSNKEAVFRGETDAAENYKKISYKIKSNEIIFTGDVETVKRQIQYEEQMKEDERLLRGRYYLAIMESKYKGTFEDFKNGRQTKTKILNEEMSEDSIKRKHQEAADSGYSGTLADYKKLLAESKDIPQTSNEERLYNEAVFAGFKGSLEEWRESVEAGKQKTLLEEAMYPPELKKTADYSFKELSEIPKKVLLERYHKDIADGEFEGSFYEWLQLKKEEEKTHHKKELKALEELTNKPQC